MEGHIETRQEYVRLVRAGKQDEAQKVLETIWNRKKANVVETKVEQVEIVEKIKPKYSNIDDLIKINGIGKKTISDMNVMFKDLKSLIDALESNRVALRDDIVEKLKEELI